MPFLISNLNNKWDFGCNNIQRRRSGKSEIHTRFRPQATASARRCRLKHQKIFLDGPAAAAFWQPEYENWATFPISAGKCKWTRWQEGISSSRLQKRPRNNGIGENFLQMCKLLAFAQKNFFFLAPLGTNTPSSQCIKITQNVAFEFLDFWHFPPIFVLLKRTCLVTLFDCKL